jgi:hypothetical protein
LEHIKAPVTCIVCNHTQEKVEVIRAKGKIFTSNDVIRVKCENCSSIFGPISIIKTENLEYYYKLAYSFFKEGDTSGMQRDVLLALKPTKSGKYLNYACGIVWGTHLQRLIDTYNFDIYGYDFTIKDPTDRLLNKLDDSMVFDGLGSNNYIEHIQKPYDQFREWNRMLKIGATMVHQGCFAYDIGFTPFHILYLSEKGLKIICEKTGFELLSYSSTIAFFRKTHNLV